MMYDDDEEEIEVLDEVRHKLSALRAGQSKSSWIPLLQLIEDHIDACHELLAYARNHADYTQSQQWRDWAHRLDTILPEIRRYWC